jgi:peptidylprolyl isomerase
MRVGGVRRLYVPGPLAYPKGLPAAAGRPRVPPASAIVIDAALRYIPGLE